MYIQVCTQVMYHIVGSHLCISLIFSSSSRGALSHFGIITQYTFYYKKPTNNFRYAHKIEHTHKKLCAFRYVCTQVMYYSVGSHLWISLILSHLREGRQDVFGVITQYTFYLKSLQKTAGRCKQYSKHISNYVNLGMYLGNVLYSRFSFMDQLHFQLIFEKGISPFLAL